MLVGPVFTREAATSPRRARFYVFRTVYVTALFVLMATAWLVVAGTQIIRNVGDMARFGSILFQILAPLQLALVLFLSALRSAGSVFQEKDRNTLILLLMTRMRNHELVLGKLFASLLEVFVMIAAALPVFMLIVLFGGVSFLQVGRVFALTVCTALVAGSLGSTLAFWREKTFQTLSLTALGIVFWIGAWESVGAIGGTVPGVECSYRTLAIGFSPLGAILSATRPSVSSDLSLGPIQNGVDLFLVTSILATVILNSVAIWWVRVWNPTREIRPGQEDEHGEGIWGAQHGVTTDEQDSQGPSTKTSEQARAGHVDARVRQASMKSREVWDNPILWREICTWAYGRKVLVIRAGYLTLFFGVAAALYGLIASGATLEDNGGLSTVIPAAAQPLAPFFLVSVVIINALAVTSVTNERDGRSLDLLLVTDLSPKEFLFGKMGGVFWITREMVVLPLLLCVYLWHHGGVSAENLLYIIGGLLVMNVFVSMLGIHCGKTYSNSRTAITVSLGTVFFLFLGVVTCILMMISFSGSFQTQLGPFLGFIVGGGIGLYVTMGYRNPSSAIGVASITLPVATFFAITSFLLNRSFSVFFVTVVAYGFTSLAMMMPALFEFDIAQGRTRTADDD